MTELTHLTIAEARDGLKAKTFSATELTQAHVDAIEKARALNAYVLETPEKALAMAKTSDERIAKGEARDLEGIPLGIKDLFCTEGVVSTAGSKILGNFTPPYESTGGLEDPRQLHPALRIHRHPEPLERRRRDARQAQHG
ncbi:MAG: gatA [Microvirga sp.]|nr:gatA [Microvirga sp.]